MLVFPHVFQGGVWNMTLGKIACVELTSVPDMIFEARRYEYRPQLQLYHIGHVFRTNMPEESLFKVTCGVQDKLFLMNFI